MGELIHGQATAGGVDVAEFLPRNGFLPAPLPSSGETLAQGSTEETETPISTPGSHQQRGVPLR